MSTPALGPIKIGTGCFSSREVTTVLFTLQWTVVFLLQECYFYELSYFLYFYTSEFYVLLSAFFL